MYKAALVKAGGLRQLLEGRFQSGNPKIELRVLGGVPRMRERLLFLRVVGEAEVEDGFAVFLQDLLIQLGGVLACDGGTVFEGVEFAVKLIGLPLAAVVFGQMKPAEERNEQDRQAQPDPGLDFFGDEQADDGDNGQANEGLDGQFKVDADEKQHAEEDDAEPSQAA